MSITSEPTVLWAPRDNQCRLRDFMSEASARHGAPTSDYESFRQWTVDNLSAFWVDVWRFFDLPARDLPTVALAEERMPGARWFPGLRMNYAEAMLRMPGRADSDVVVISASQSRETVEVTAAELRDSVARAAAGLRRLGVRKGDRVAAFAPNIPETLVLMLATASLGAIFTSCAPEFGATSVLDRWGQIEPTVVLVVDGYRYGEKSIDKRRTVSEILDGLPGNPEVVWLPYLHPSEAGPPGAIRWQDLVALPADLTFEPVLFDHPLYILFSSGTTGLPKAIVHGHGGIAIVHCASQGLQYDLGPRDVFLWFTTTGWMMWNYLVSALMLGVTIVLYDGDPLGDDPGTLWRLAEQTGVTYFGTSASYIMACRRAALTPGDDFDLSAIRGVGSTGSPLPAEGFRWVYEAVGADLQLSSQSGGTDICSGFVGSSPLTPVYEGEIACRLLGVAVASFDADGNSVLGQVGEMVITKPTPSMPLGFWGDSDGSRLRAAYFEPYPGVWRQGDWIEITDRGSCIISGRSDSTLNRGGVRLGTSEFYAVVEEIPEVVDSLVVHLDENDSDELLLFVQLSPGVDLDDGLRQSIRHELRSRLSPRHAPDRVEQVPSIPKTLTGKKVEVPVKRILTGVPLGQAVTMDALVDPSALDPFLALARERVSG